MVNVNSLKTMICPYIIFTCSNVFLCLITITEHSVDHDEKLWNAEFYLGQSKKEGKDQESSTIYRFPL